MVEYSLPNQPPDRLIDPHHVVIIGGGIAGLSAAYYLQRAARAAGVGVQYTLVERDVRLGGKLVTDTDGEFVVEGGPDSFITQKPWGLRLARELGLDDQLIGTNDRRHKVHVLVNGRPRPMPDGMLLVVPTKFLPFAFSPVVSPLGKLRMALDLLIPARRGGADETLADFIRRRLGAEALDRLAEPLLAGIHNSEADRQSLLATFPRLREVEQQYGSLIRGMLAARRQGDTAKRRQGAGAASESTKASAPARPFAHSIPVSPFVTFKGGVATLASALVRALDGRVLAGQGALALDHDPAAEQPYRVRLASGGMLAADAVILAAPAFAAAELLAPGWPTLAAGLRQIRYVTTATVSLAYRASDIGEPLDGYGLVIPRTERRRINAVTITSAKFTHRAPAGAALLRVFVGGSRNPDVPGLADAALLELVRAELRDTLGIRAEPLWCKIYRWPRSNPQYDVGHFERIDALEAGCPAGLYLAGSAYRGVGIPDCVRQGEEAAAKVMAFLGEGAASRHPEATHVMIGEGR
jgi:protoporphyrinogen/coproporphyrinogen III oxidase